MAITSVNVLTLGAVTLFLYFFGKKRERIRQFVQNISSGYLVLCMLGLFAITMLMSVMGSANIKLNSALIHIVAGCICILGCAFVAIWLLLLKNHESKNVYKQMAEMNQKLLAVQEQYYQMMLEKETETRRFRHDITNHMLCLGILLKEREYEDAERYLENLTGELQELGTKVQTGNRLVNAILTDISQKYPEVLLDWRGHLPQIMQLSNIDICTIFSNVLENAFTAAASCKEEGKVTVEIWEAGHGLKVVLKNNKSVEVEVRDGSFITREEDKKNHGFGILNVTECVKRNGGTVEYDYAEDSFTVKLLLVNIF